MYFPAFSALVMYAAVYATKIIALGAVHLALQLVIEILVGALTYAIVLWCLDRKGCLEVITFLRR